MLDPFLRRSAAAFALAILGFAPSAHAADNSSAVRAARLTFVQGAVSVRAVNQAATPAQVNQPLLTGTLLSTGGDGQAEVEFEDGSVVRLTPNSALSLDNLAVDPGGIFTSNLSLLHGLAYLELRATPQYQYFLNAGSDVLSPVENTTVRVNFDEPPAIFAVLDGTAHIERQPGPEGTPNNGGFQADVRVGESLRGDTASYSRYFLTQEIAQDSWDQWNEDRDKAAAASASGDTDVRDGYAGAQGYGWSDLDANGSWYDVPGQGQVWQPNLAADDSGFDPYGYGAWVWQPGTGYLWASGYSWGWTPYRCGTWSYYNGFGWGWVPGTGCGGLGWGFAGGGGYPVNLSRVPPGYRPVRPPTGHGPEHPLVPVRTAVQPERPRNFAPARGPRQIGGLTATPIAPKGFNVVSGGSAVGSSLRRDYPVDTHTHAPVLGLASTTPAVVRTSPGALAPGQRPATASGPAGMARPAAPQQPYAGRGYVPPAGGATGAQSSRPAPQTAPQRGAPSVPPAAARQYAPSAPSAPTAPPAPAPHPTYSAPPAQHPAYSPPPEPRYSPPPEPRYSPPPAPHYSPPPPPPPAAPAAPPASSAKPK